MIWRTFYVLLVDLRIYDVWSKASFCNYITQLSANDWHAQIPNPILVKYFTKVLYDLNNIQTGFWAAQYIHNWSIQPVNQDYDLASPNSYVVCVNFTLERRDLWKLFTAVLFFARNLLRGNCQGNIFYIFFWCLVAYGLNRGLTSNKLTQYILDYGDFNGYRYYCN